jgi:N-alpha-acetyltransferase 15/16, NatA auxiliary subunit
VSKLVPDELSLDTLNSLYLQRHSTDPQANLAAAKVSHKLKASRDDVETLVFALLAPQVQLNIPVSESPFGYLIIEKKNLGFRRRPCQQLIF